MGEFGCLGDESFQDLNVEGKTTVGGNAELKGRIEVNGNCEVGGELVVLEDSTLGALNSTSGIFTGALLGAPYLPAIVTVTNAQVLADMVLVASGAAGAAQKNAPNGTIILLEWTGTGGAATLTLPPALPGYSLLIIQKNEHSADTDTLTLKADPTVVADKIMLGSLASPDVTAAVVAAADFNHLQITSHDTNSKYSIGSTIKLHCLEANKWFLMGNFRAHGNGGGAGAGDIVFGN